MYVCMTSSGITIGSVSEVLPCLLQQVDLVTIESIGRQLHLSAFALALLRRPMMTYAYWYIVIKPYIHN